jgi:hypothetical protein
MTDVLYFYIHTHTQARYVYVQWLNDVRLCSD